MQPFNFQRFVMTEAKPVIEDLLQAMGGDLTIFDKNWYLVLGDPAKTKGGGKYPIEAEGRTIGWLMGGPQAEELARFLAFMAEHRLLARARYAEMEALQRENALLERQLVDKKNQLLQQKS